jgi:hypothetical protein
MLTRSCARRRRHTQGNCNNDNDNAYLCLTRMLHNATIGGVIVRGRDRSRRPRRCVAVGLDKRDIRVVRDWDFKLPRRSLHVASHLSGMEMCLRKPMGGTPVGREGRSCDAARGSARCVPASRQILARPQSAAPPLRRCRLGPALASEILARKRPRKYLVRSVRNGSTRPADPSADVFTDIFPRTSCDSSARLQQTAMQPAVEQSAVTNPPVMSAVTAAAAVEVVGLTACNHHTKQKVSSSPLALFAAMCLLKCALLQGIAVCPIPPFCYCQ